MGLWINHLDTVTIRGERSLYVYLLDYGWPDGQWENLFKKHFMKMADLASETGAVVIGSPRGSHFGNEVLSWHRVGSLDADRVLPGLLITKTHPSYFQDDGLGDDSPAKPGMEDLLVIPLRDMCNDETDFLKTVEGIFADLKSDSELRDFEIASFDISNPNIRKRGRSIIDAIELKPGAFGVSLDLKKLIDNR